MPFQPSFLSKGSKKSRSAVVGARRNQRFALERLEDRLLLTVGVEEIPLRSTGGGVAGITSGVNGDPNLYFTMPSTNSIGVYNPKTAGPVLQYPIPTLNANAQNLAVGDSGVGDWVAGSDGKAEFARNSVSVHLFRKSGVSGTRNTVLRCRFYDRPGTDFVL